MKTKTEYDNFDGMMRELVKIPHAEIKQKLDAEKRAKKRRKAKKSGASCEGA